MTENHGDLRGWMILPSGVLLLVLGAKALFATFDPSIVENPSLFDPSGNTFWDTATLIANISLLSIIGIHYWYKAKVGSVVASPEKKQMGIAVGFVIVFLFAGAIALDYNFVAPFSFAGFLFCFMWLFGYLKLSGLKRLHLVNLILQFIAWASGPFIFAGLKADTLVYMRHVVGLCFFTGGILILISGIMIHSHFMEQIRKNRNSIPQHES